MTFVIVTVNTHRTHTQAHKQTHTDTHRHTHTYRHTHTHAHTHRFVLFWFGKFRRGRRSFDDEHNAAHQRLLLWLQTPRQRNQINQGLTKGYHSRDSGKSRHWDGSDHVNIARFRKVLALGRQRPCPYCTIIFVSENDAHVDPPLVARRTTTG